MRNLVNLSFNNKSSILSIWVCDKNYKIDAILIKFKRSYWECRRRAQIHSLGNHCFYINQNDCMLKFLIIQNIILKSDEIVRFWPFHWLSRRLELYLWGPNWSFRANTDEIAVLNWASNIIHIFLCLVNHKSGVYFLITWEFPLRNPNIACVTLSLVKQV